MHRPRKSGATLGRERANHMPTSEYDRHEQAQARASLVETDTCATAVLPSLSLPR